MATRLFLTLAIIFTFTTRGLWAFNPLDQTNECDYVILTHDSFYSEALRLQNHRNQPGLRSCLISVSEVIIPAFAGANDVETIRNFVVYAYSQWKVAPTYLILIGDANYPLADPPETINVSVNNYLPAKVSVNLHKPWGGDYNYMEDGWYVDSPFAGDKKPIIHIGRIPARTNTQVRNAVDKIIHYDGITGNPSWLSRILMLVGDANINANNAVYRTFNDQLFNEEFSNWYPVPTTIYSSDYFNTPQMERVLTELTGSHWDAGFGFINAFGNTTSYKSFVLTLTIAPYWLGSGATFAKDILTPTNRFPLVFASTCYPNPFWANLPDTQGVSIGEDFLLGASNRGAIGIVGPAHLNNINELYILNKLFAHALLTDGIKNLGRLFSLTKAKFFENNMGFEDLARQYTLLGDPATNLKIHPLPTRNMFYNGAEIEDAPLLQNRLAGKSSGINNENSRVVHSDSVYGTIEPLHSERMYRVKAHHQSGSPNYVEWIIQDGLNINITRNMHFSFWMNVVQSPSGNGKVVIDANTTGGRVKDNMFIMDQHGHSLNAKDRPPVSPGWKFYYADLSPLQWQNLTDVRIRYETTSTSDSGELLVYFDQIRIGDIRPGHMEEIMNYSFEWDDNGDGTPDFWTNLWGQTGTEAPQVTRSNIFARHGEYSMQVFDVWCNGQGAQHIFHANEGLFSYYDIYFRHYAPEPTTFRVKVINMDNAEVILNWPVTATPNPEWGHFVNNFPNPAAGYGTARLKLQIIPEDCLYPVFIDEMYVSEPIPVGAGDDVPEGVGLNLKASPNPFNPAASISYVLSKPDNVSVSVFDLKGRRVIDLYQGNAPAGTHRVVWDGRDGSGNIVSSGTYFVHVKTGSGSEKVKITLLK